MEELSLTHQLSMAMDNIRRAQKFMKKAVKSDEEPVFLLLHFAEVSAGNHVPISALKEAMGVSAAAATQFVKKLESHGYVTRTPDERDRRIVLIAMTEKGRQKTASILAVFESVLEGLVKELGPTDTKIYIDLLNRTSAYLEKESNE